jgi:hypothetical protein
MTIEYIVNALSTALLWLFVYIKLCNIKQLHILIVNCYVVMIAARSKKWVIK